MTLSAPLDTINVHLRAGYIIPLQVHGLAVVQCGQAWRGLGAGDPGVPASGRTGAALPEAGRMASLQVGRPWTVRDVDPSDPFAQCGDYRVWPHILCS